MAQATRLTRREQFSMETRRIIFETAMELFAERGYDSVTVDDICEKAGVAKSTFYNLFKSKNQIIVEEFLKIDGYYEEVLKKIQKKKKSNVDKMIEFINLTLKYIDDQGIDTIKVTYHSQIGPSLTGSPVASSQRPLYKIVEGLIKDAQDVGEVRNDISAAELTETLVQGTRGVVYDWCLQNGSFDLLKAGGRYLKVVLDGLRRK
jgi:TetR/AcrR family fatty acid metabolism transcriptional regulator